MASLHLLLPPTRRFALVAAAIAARVMSAAMLEVAQLDFVRTARAQGLSRNKVTISHVLRNALLPVITILGVLSTLFLHECERLLIPWRRD